MYPESQAQRTELSFQSFIEGQQGQDQSKLWRDNIKGGCCFGRKWFLPGPHYLTFLDTIKLGNSESSKIGDCGDSAL